MGTWTPVSAADMEVDTTASRHTGPRNWLRSVEWLIAAGLHPKTNQTTLLVAQDLAKRMDYSTGHVRYDLEGTADRVGIDRSNVARHVVYLRELGSLAWAQRGSRRNVRRLLGLPGYAATATVYAAVIPAVYDHALGHRIVGDGYGSRIVRDYRQMPDTRPSATPETPVDNASSGPVDNSAKRSLATPSLTSADEEKKVQMVGGFNYTSRQRASQSTASIPHQAQAGSNEDGTKRRSPQQVKWEIQETRLVRAMVNWTQTERRERRLAFVLRPFFDRGLRAHDIAAELAGMTLGWKPKHPAAFIRTALAEQAAADAQLAADEARRASATWQQKNTEAATDLASLELLFASPRTDDDRREARARAQYDIQVVIDHLEDHGDDDAIDLYGTRLASRAAGLAASPTFQAGVFA
ncbi:hypothetical protein [Streptomyces sp. NPDC005969]|uniref:hypothetical protein n=1 Tax=Streptomyces sp. NPDC005969 TaxID=3156722 RepID=UPI00340F627E